ncbi:MAG: DMT family transporter, partial [Pseudomonadota bacterium]
VVLGLRSNTTQVERALKKSSTPRYPFRHVTMSTLSPRATTVALFSVLTLLWSFSFLLIKLSVTAFAPATLVFWRLVIGAAVVSVAAALLYTPSSRARTPWPLVLWVALLGNALPFYLIHRGELTVDSGVASILMGSMPIATCIVAWLGIRERPSGRQILGIGFGFAGLISLIGWDSVAGLGRTEGQLMVAGGAVCYAVSAVLVRRAGEPPSLRVAALTLWVAAAMSLPLAIGAGLLPHQPPTTGVWLAVATLGVGCTGLAQVVYFSLLSRITANHFALINNFIPLLGYGWAIWLLGETPRTSALLAATLILLGARLVLSTPRSTPTT